MIEWKALKTKRSYALIDPKGKVLIDSDIKTKEDCWKIFLGWPSLDEIESKQKEGYFVKIVSIIVID